MKFILISLCIFMPLFLVWRLILKRLTAKANYQKIQAQIIGNTKNKEIEEIDFLAKFFKGKFSPDWKARIKKKILSERFEELTKKYSIIIDKK